MNRDGEGEAGMIRIDGSTFKDAVGRTLLLRGVNLGGSSKVPMLPNGATHIPGDFFEHRQVSFVGRPFPLEEADEHFARLREWGFTFVRLLVTWEAVEHAGPGIYDEAYLGYVHDIVNKAEEHGIAVIIDPHQDVWSRFSGGDGAPGWTFEVVGLDITKFHETGAAIVHQTHGDPFPRMIWPSNGGKLAAATMFTLFFGGDDFAPATDVEGEPVQTYLQRHYIESILRIADRLKDLTNVIGYGTMNEPLRGYIGWEDLRIAGGLIRLGPSPTPFQAMLLGSGVPQTVDVWGMSLRGEKVKGVELIDPMGVRAWLPGHDCVWRRNGVWDYDVRAQPTLLRPDHFTRVNGREVDFGRDYYRPFANRFAEAIRSVHPRALIFIEPDPRSSPPKWGPEDAKDIVYAPHWYDGYVLMMKDYRSFLAADYHTGSVILGSRRIRRSFRDQLGRFFEESKERLGGVPVLLGEFGIAFDLRGKRAYRDGDFELQNRAMNRSFSAVEDNLLSCALWNYTADNTNERGDQWNGEDLSIFSRDQQFEPADIHSGGRALEAVVRPYPRKIAGEPMWMAFDYKKGVFEFSFRHDSQIEAPTEIFVPNYQFPWGYSVEISDGTFRVDFKEQILVYRPDSAKDLHTIRLVRKVEVE